MDGYKGEEFKEAWSKMKDEMCQKYNCPYDKLIGKQSLVEYELMGCIITCWKFDCDFYTKETIINFLDITMKRIAKNEYEYKEYTKELEQLNWQHYFNH